MHCLTRPEHCATQPLNTNYSPDVSCLLGGVKSANFVKYRGADDDRLLETGLHSLLVQLVSSWALSNRNWKTDTRVELLSCNKLPKKNVWTQVWRGTARFTNYLNVTHVAARVLSEIQLTIDKRVNLNPVQLLIFSFYIYIYIIIKEPNQILCQDIIKENDSKTSASLLINNNKCMGNM